MTLVAIHQPNFFPWLGYFDKIARADIFVFLDAVNFSNGSWTNRVKLLVGNDARWFTCPIVRREGLGKICDLKIDDGKPWRKKALRTLETNYASSAHYPGTIEVVEPLLRQQHVNLSAFNMAAVRALAAAVGLSCKFIVQSELKVSGSGTDLLADIVKAVGGDSYLVGGGAGGYQDNDVFEGQGIEVIAQDFRHPEYPQLRVENFVPGLSVLDIVMNRGFDGTSALLEV